LHGHTSRFKQRSSRLLRSALTTASGGEFDQITDRSDFRRRKGPNLKEGVVVCSAVDRLAMRPVPANPKRTFTSVRVSISTRYRLFWIALCASCVRAAKAESEGLRRLTGTVILCSGTQGQGRWRQSHRD
jgi:hypothetical protein